MPGSSAGICRATANARKVSAIARRFIQVVAMKMQAENIKAKIGSIVNVERSALFDQDVAERCLELLDERGVLVFPRINLSDKEQLAFTDRLGARVNFTSRVAGVDSDTKDVYTITLDPKVN